MNTTKTAIAYANSHLVIRVRTGPRIPPTAGLDRTVDRTVEFHQPLVWTGLLKGLLNSTNLVWTGLLKGLLNSTNLVWTGLLKGQV